MPVKPEDLAKHLAILEKSGESTAAFIVELLKAVNNIVKDSGLFVEKGTSTSERTFVEKA